MQKGACWVCGCKVDGSSFFFCRFAGDEGGSMAGGTRGASPADLLHRFFSFAARFKALKRWGSFCLRCSGRFPLMLPEATAEEDDGSGDERRSPQVQEFLGASL